MKLIVALVLGLGFGIGAHADCNREAQVIGTVTSQTGSDLDQCAVTINFTSFSPSIVCPLIREDVGSSTIQVSNCLKIGAEVAGVIQDLGNGVYFLDQ